MVVDVVVVVFPLELELDDEYPDGGVDVDRLGDILGALGDILLDDDDCRVRSAFRSICLRLGRGIGVGGRFLTGVNSMVG